MANATKKTLNHIYLLPVLAEFEFYVDFPCK